MPSKVTLIPVVHSLSLKYTSPLEGINRNIREGEYLFEKDFNSPNSANSNDSSFNIPNLWGIVGRINDFEDYLNMKPDLVEIHLTWRDLVEFDIDKFVHFDTDVLIFKSFINKGLFVLFVYVASKVGGSLDLLSEWGCLMCFAERLSRFQML